MSTQRYREAVPCEEQSHDGCRGEHFVEIVEYNTSCITAIRTLTVADGVEHEEQAMHLPWSTVDALKRLLEKR